MTAFVYILFLVMSLMCFESARLVDFGDLEYRMLDFEFEVLLKMYLKEWRFLTEDSKMMDLGEVLPKRTFIRESYTRDIKISNHRNGRVVDTSKPRSKTLGNTKVSGLNTSLNNEVSHRMDTNVKRMNHEKSLTSNVSQNLTNVIKTLEEEGLSGSMMGAEVDEEDQEEEVLSRGKRGGGMPVMYMPGGGKKTRKCSQVNGLLGGFNTFNYLTFVTGVITLVLNVNNNLNNNNNNNNLNNNNDISNNNVNANTNTQNANQVVLFPPGRKRRSLADWLLQVASMRSAITTDKDIKSLSAEQKSNVGTELETSWCLATEAVVVALQLFDVWIQASTGVSGDCGWAEYCKVLHDLTSKGSISGALAKPVRSFSKLVSPQWVGSTTCLLHRARCKLL
ncbi:putative uncharacterized protein DDB_G0277255 [Homarus americanus]|uniref:Putative myb-like protein W-like n=1 Tax=Homarus americanus TaxID=6706 RepID=A0A8J5N467_HOMAM|nr:putative uncharacterized protein DDB_G0277255 [Homarus americanus]KAG7173098.1 putative myb-like protein W-like [Homarus americanus]